MIGDASSHRRVMTGRVTVILSVRLTGMAKKLEPERLPLPRLREPRDLAAAKVRARVENPREVLHTSMKLAAG